MRSSLRGSTNTLVLWHQQWLGRRPLSRKICAQSDPPPLKSADVEKYLFMTSQPLELAKKVQLSRTGSRPRAFQRAIDEVRTLPLSPPKGSDGQKLTKKLVTNSLTIF